MDDEKKRLNEIQTQSNTFNDSKISELISNKAEKETIKSLLAEKNNLLEKYKDIKSQLHACEEERRLLHNSLQEHRGNIRVIARIRPFLSHETEEKGCSFIFLYTHH